MQTYRITTQKLLCLVYATTYVVRTSASCIVVQQIAASLPDRQTAKCSCEELWLTKTKLIYVTVCTIDLLSAV